MLHDANAGAGAMAHILLPSKSLARDVTNLAKFPETAVPLLVEQLTALGAEPRRDRKSTRLNSSHGYISYAVFCLKKKKQHRRLVRHVTEHIAASARMR